MVEVVLVRESVGSGLGGRFGCASGVFWRGYGSG